MPLFAYLLVSIWRKQRSLPGLCTYTTVGKSETLKKVGFSPLDWAFVEFLSNFLPDKSEHVYFKRAEEECHHIYQELLFEKYQFWFKKKKHTGALWYKS